MALTDTEIRRARPADAPYRLAEAGNLFLWVTPSGGKHWRWGYRFEGKQKLMTFGKYPDVSLARARKRDLQQLFVLTDGTLEWIRLDRQQQCVKLSCQHFGRQCRVKSDQVSESIQGRDVIL